MINDKEMLMNSLKDAGKKTPILILGRAINVFKSNFNGEIFQINSNEDVDKLESSIKTLVVEINLINNYIIKKLLKVNHLIVLSNVNISQKYLINFNSIIKLKTSCKNSLVSVSNGVKMLDERIDVIDIYSSECPKLYFLRKMNLNSKECLLLGDII